MTMKKEFIDETMDVLPDMQEDVNKGLNVGSSEVDESFESMGYADLGEQEPKKKEEWKSTSITEQTEENMSSYNLQYSEEQYRDTEFRDNAKPIIQQEVTEAMKVHDARLKREAAELIYEHDMEIVADVSDARRADKKERKRRAFRSKVKSAILTVVLVGVLLIVCTNSQIKPLLTTVWHNLVSFATDIMNDEETNSNKLVDDAIKGLGDSLNRQNTKVYIEYEEE